MINFFLSRPILSIVLSVVITLFGLTCLTYLPVEQLPNLSPPAVSVSAQFSGATAETMARSVAEPLERAIIGTENMIYMSSNSTTPGSMNLTVYFQTGTDPNVAVDEIQKRVNIATLTLPEEVKKNGVSVKRAASGILLFIAIQDQNHIYDAGFLTNYATVHIVPELQNVPGVSEAAVINAGEYAMRIWLKPDRIAEFNLSPANIRDAVLEQNAVYSIGEIGQEPSPPNTKLTIPIFTSGLLKTVKDFENIIIKADPDGSMILLKDIARVELGADDYSTYATLNGEIGSFISIKKDPTANALNVAKQLKEKLEHISHFFPPGIEYSIPYDTTNYIKISIKKVAITLLTAAMLVSLIIYLFLNSMLAALIPIIAMIVSIVGTFLGMYFLGYTINVLTLFGMILAIGIVVDDAIIVVEKVEFNMRTLGLSAKEAARKAMEDLGAPIVAIVFALFAVFIPVTFMAGIAGQLYKQFAITIVISVVISGFVALTLSPVLAEIFFKNRTQPTKFSLKFSQFFGKITDIYIHGVDWLINKKKIGIGLWFLVLCAIGILFHLLPTGLVPTEDQGVLIVSSTLPDGASLARTKEVTAKIEKIVQEQPGIRDYIALNGFGTANAGLLYLALKDWNQRKGTDLQASQILKKLNQQFSQISEANVMGHNLPPIPAASDSDFYEFWVINQGNWTNEQLQRVADQIIEKGKKRPEFSFLYSTKTTDSLGIYLDVNKLQAKSLGVKLDDLFYTLQVLFGSVYVNDFSDLGRLFKVIIQAESSWRSSLNWDIIKNIFIPTSTQKMVPLESLVTAKFAGESSQVSHYNGNGAILINVGPAASSEAVIAAMEELAKESLLPDMSFAWSGAAYQANAAGGAIVFALIGGLLMLFLALAALYGRWILPLIVLLAIPFGILGALLAILTRSIPMDLYFQVGLIASIGISAKNAILIVERARTNREEGMGVVEAAREAARNRFRPIILTSLSLALAVFPLTISTGAGAGSEHSVGTGILGGMFLATLLGIFFVPFFFRLLESEKKDE